MEVAAVFDWRVGASDYTEAPTPLRSTNLVGAS